MADAPYRVLFVDMGNSARSILAEAALNREGMSRFKAFSGGLKPKGEVHPMTISLLKELNFDPAFARSKDVEEFLGGGAEPFDFVFTIYDEEPEGPAPTWPGSPIQAHWPVPDPVRVEGTDAEKGLAFAEAFRMISQRVSIFVNLPWGKIDRDALQEHLNAIGRNR